MYSKFSLLSPLFRAKHKIFSLLVPKSHTGGATSQGWHVCNDNDQWLLLYRQEFQKFETFLASKTRNFCKVVEKCCQMALFYHTVNYQLPLWYKPNFKMFSQLFTRCHYWELLKWKSRNLQLKFWHQLWEVIYYLCWEEPTANTCVGRSQQLNVVSSLAVTQSCQCKCCFLLF